MLFTKKKREDMDTSVCAVSLYVAEIPKASIKDQEPPLPIIPIGIVAYGFVGQPLSKQLYIVVAGDTILIFCDKLQCSVFKNYFPCRINTRFVSS